MVIAIKTSTFDSSNGTRTRTRVLYLVVLVTYIFPSVDEVRGPSIGELIVFQLELHDGKLSTRSNYALTCELKYQTPARA